MLLKEKIFDKVWFSDDFSSIDYGI